MTADEVRTYMKQCRRIKKEMVAKYNSLYELRSLAEKTTSTLTGMPSAHGAESKVEHYAIRLVEMQMDIEECVDELSKVQQKTLHMIELASDPLARAILTEYHIVGKTADLVAESVGYGRAQVFRLMNKAYEEIAQRCD